jgi:cytochrome P450
MGNSFRRLLEDRASWEAICRDPGLIPNAIEEVLRFDGSVIAWRHKTRESVEIGEARLSKDAKLLLLLASANRDPAVFPDPDRFDIGRQNAREHLSFGVGVHNCLGAPLARLEARIVLEEVSQRLPSLRLAKNAEVEFPPSISMRGPLSLRVTWSEERRIVQSFVELHESSARQLLPAPRCSTINDKECQDDQVRFHCNSVIASHPFG